MDIPVSFFGVTPGLSLDRKDLLPSDTGDDRPDRKGPGEIRPDANQRVHHIFLQVVEDLQPQSRNTNAKRTLASVIC